MCHRGSPPLCASFPPPARSSLPVRLDISRLFSTSLFSPTYGHFKKCKHFWPVFQLLTSLTSVCSFIFFPTFSSSLFISLQLYYMKCKLKHSIDYRTSGLSYIIKHTAGIQPLCLSSRHSHVSLWSLHQTQSCTSVAAATSVLIQTVCVSEIPEREKTRLAPKDDILLQTRRKFKEPSQLHKGCFMAVTSELES